jgi:hypothetical protein
MVWKFHSFVFFCWTIIVQRQKLILICNLQFSYFTVNSGVVLIKVKFEILMTEAEIYKVQET